MTMLSETTALTSATFILLVNAFAISQLATRMPALSSQRHIQLQTQRYAGMPFFRAPLNISHSPCMYPSPYPNLTAFWSVCQLPLDHVRGYNICDASGQGISFTEVNELAMELDAMVLERMDRQRSSPGRGGTCVCGASSSGKHSPTQSSNKLLSSNKKSASAYCWYRFGFAFLSELMLPIFEFPEGIDSHELCWTGNKSHQLAFLSVPPSPVLPQNWSAVMVQRHGAAYAEILRERWKMHDECGNDILILVVRRRPNQLVLNQSQRKVKTPYPVIFLSYGDEVKQRIGTLRSPTDELADIVAEANIRLDSGFSLQQVMKRFIANVKMLLDRADLISQMPKSKHNVPQWAIISFAVCGGILILIAFGLFIAKSTRRSSRTKPVAQTNRRWKAGFVGAMLFGNQAGSLIKPNADVLALIGGSKSGKGTSTTML